MIFMSIYEIRSKIMNKNESIKTKFPLHLGNNNLEIENSFSISSIFFLKLHQCMMFTPAN